MRMEVASYYFETIFISLSSERELKGKRVRQTVNENTTIFIKVILIFAI